MTRRKRDKTTTEVVRSQLFDSMHDWG